MAPPRPIPESTSQEDRTRAVRVYTPIQAHLMERLAQLVARRKELVSQDSSEKGAILALIHRAIFAAYVDCLEEGVGEEALELLRGESLAAAA